MSVIRFNRAINKLQRKIEELEKETEGLALSSPARAHIQGQIKGLRYSILTLDVLKKSTDDAPNAMDHKDRTHVG